MEQIKTVVTEAMKEIHNTKEETEAVNTRMREAADKAEADRKTANEKLAETIALRLKDEGKIPDNEDDKGENVPSHKLKALVDQRLKDHASEQKENNAQLKEIADKQSAQQKAAQDEADRRKEYELALNIQKTRFMFVKKEPAAGEQDLRYQVDEVFTDKLKLTYHAFNNPKDRKLCGVREFWDKMQVVGYWD